MAFGDSGMMSSGLVFQKILLGGGAAAIVTVGAWTADTLRDLADEVAALRISMVGLTSRVDALPPRDLMLRVQILEEDYKALEARLNQVLSRHED